MLWALTGSTAAVLAGYFCEEKKQIIESLRAELAKNERNLYVAVHGMQAGDIVLKEDVVKVDRFSGEDASVYMSEEDIGKILAVDIPAGSSLLKCMLTEAGESLREVFISQIDVPEHLREGNQVDVRISYGNAEDYVVLTEKKLVWCEEREGIVLKLNETEILMLSSAIHDCGTYKDTELYLVKYPEFQRMEESEVTYIPNREILTLLKRTEKQEERIRIEERLTKK